MQALECLGFGLKGITLCRLHPRRGVLRGVLVPTASLIRCRQAPELCHQGHRLGRKPSHGQTSSDGTRNSGQRPIALPSPRTTGIGPLFQYS